MGLKRWWLVAHRHVRRLDTAITRALCNTKVTRLLQPPDRATPSTMTFFSPRYQQRLALHLFLFSVEQPARFFSDFRILCSRSGCVTEKLYLVGHLEGVWRRQIDKSWLKRK